MANPFLDDAQFSSLLTKMTDSIGQSLGQSAGGSLDGFNARAREAMRPVLSVGSLQQAQSFTPSMGLRDAGRFTPGAGMREAQRFTPGFNPSRGASGFMPGSSISTSQKFTPFGSGFGGSNYTSFMQSLQPAIQQHYGQQSAALQAALGTNTGSSVDGTVGNPSGQGAAGGNWSDVNQWNSQIADAQQKVKQETGVLVPANVIKNIIMIESQGNPNSISDAGAYGLMQMTGSTITSGWDLARMTSDPAYGIYAGVSELAARYKDSGQMPWENVIVGYFSGHYEPMGASDGGNTDYSYQDQFRKNAAMLDSAGGSSFNGSPGTPGQGSQTTGQFSITALGAGDAPVTQEVGGHAMDYTYGSAYGVGNSHPGIDIGFAYGTQVKSAWSGEVVCLGSSAVGSGPGSSGCAGFNDDSGGIGEIMIKLDNGDEVIFGHMSSANLRPGQRVNAGDVVGNTGTAGSGAHLHLEYRKKGGCDSGWCAVDPRTMQGVSGGSGGGTGQQQANPLFHPTWTSFLGPSAAIGSETGYNPGARYKNYIGRPLFG